MVDEKNNPSLNPETVTPETPTPETGTPEPVTINPKKMLCIISGKYTDETINSIRFEINDILYKLTKESE